MDMAKQIGKLLLLPIFALSLITFIVSAKGAEYMGEPKSKVKKWLKGAIVFLVIISSLISSKLGDLY